MKIINILKPLCSMLILSLLSLESIEAGSMLTSLKLESNATTLNIGEKATLTAVGTYSANSTKEVGENVTYTIIPADSVKVSGSILTALKDGNVTVQATVGGVVSNSVELHIIWVVDGHVLPPEPDKTINDSTLLGIDVNDNGVRDDVERWIYDRYKDEHPILIPLKMQEARAYRYIIQDPSQARERDKVADNAFYCEEAFGSFANAFGRKPLFEKESEIRIKENKERENIQFNTTQRARAYGLYNQNLSGGVYDQEWPSEKWIENCDFNTTKYIEMSEKL